jgi:hypothetical protein
MMESMCVCVCFYACTRERERERESGYHFESLISSRIAYVGSHNSPSTYRLFPITAKHFRLYNVAYRELALCEERHLVLSIIYRNFIFQIT